MNNSCQKNVLLQNMADGYFIETFTVYVALAVVYRFVFYWLDLFFGVYFGYILSSTYTHEPKL